MFSSVEIEINSDCNMSCTYCPNNEHQRIEKGEMDSDLFTSIMAQLKEIDYVGRISFHFYNEPLLAKNLNLFIQVTREYLPECVLVIYSNGTLLTERRLVELLDLGVTKFFITKHEDVKKAYVFEKTYKKLSKSLKSTIHYQDFTQIDYSNRAGLLKDVATEDVGATPCYLPLYLMVITLKGNVLPCYEDFYQTLSMGNVGDTNIMDIWNSKKYSEFRNELRRKNGRKTNDTCRNCTCVRF
jgi:radical SAM protein with 4Fe4S-binding SPASM domain